MDRDGSGVSALVGLDGFVMRRQLLEESTAEWWLAVETTEDRAWCEQCGVRATGHGRRRVMVRDLPITDRPVVLVWAKRLWRCTEPVCAVNTWSEECDEIAPRAVLTERARAEICRRVGPGEQSVAQAARDFGVSWHAAMAAVRDHGQPRVDHLARLGAPGDRAGRDVVPDRHRRAPNPARDRDHGPRHGPPRRCSACSQRHRRDRLARREARPMADGDRPCGDRPLPALRHRRRRRAARRPPGGRPLPRRAFGQRRARRGPPPHPADQPRTPGPQARPALPDPAATAGGPRTPRAHRLRPSAVPPRCRRPQGEVGAAYLAKELLRESYLTADAFDARRRLVAFYDYCNASDVPELERLARTIARWEVPILRWHRTRLTNAATEGTNLVRWASSSP